MTPSGTYQISIASDEVRRAKTEPPVEPSNTLLRHTWDFPRADFHRLPALRRWIAGEDLRDVREEGFEGTGGDLSAAGLVSYSTPFSARPAVEEARLLSGGQCPTCGRPDARLVDAPMARLGDELAGGRLLTYLQDLDAHAMPVEAVEALRAAGLARGLWAVPVEAPGVSHVILSSDAGVGEPVAPFGTTGERCPTCGRAYRKTADGRPYPALPRYAMYHIFERPGGDSQWVWGTMDGQLRPMVTPDVARWLRAHDPELAFVKHGWSPDELEHAFLPKEYR